MDKKALSHLSIGLLCGIFITTVVFSFLVARGGLEGERVILKVSHSLDMQHPVHAGFEKMAEKLLEKSGGQLVLQIFPNSQLGSDVESLEQVQRGALSMAMTSAAVVENFVPEMSVFGLPYLFRDHDHYWRVLDGPVGQQLLVSGSTKGLHGLMYFDAGARSFYTVSRPILTPEDLKGMKIRVLGSDTVIAGIGALGASPTPLPFGELYTALQQGMVDGAENNAPSYFTSRHYEVAKHFALDEHARIPDVLVINQGIWEALSPQQQQWVQEAADEAAAYQRELWQQRTESSMAQLEAAGVKIYVIDTTPFQAAAEKAYERYQGTPMGNLIRQIREVK